jgi:hypothetical protein
MENDKEVALYYPYIDITDESLIKTSALYWDELQTIVPQNLDNPYQNEISQQAFREKFLRKYRIRWDDDEVEKTGMEFFSDLKNGHVLDIAKKILAEKPRDGRYYTRLHIDKISKDIKKMFEQFLNEKLDCDEEGFFYIPAIIAHAYMSRLASTIAETKNLVPLTNETKWHKIAIDRYINYSLERREDQAQLANLSLQTLSVDPAVSLIDILRFRDSHRPELINYRREIHKLAHQISKGLNTAEKQTLFEEIVKNEIIPAKREIEAKLKSVANFFMVADIVFTATAIGTIILSDGQAWLGSLLQGTASLGLNFYGNVRAERAITDKPVGYLYKSEQRFGSNK